MTGLNVNRASFIRSAATEKQFIFDSRRKIAFAGRSNVGKSSVINCLLNRKQFARVGSEPGKTIHVNYFLIDDKLYFIDLPGYGYARVSREEKERWAALMESFFRTEGSFDMGVLIVDSRHKPTADDLRMAEWFRSAGLPFLVVANKTDKLKKSETEGCLSLVRETLALEENELIPFSAEKRSGRELLLQRLTEA